MFSTTGSFTVNLAVKSGLAFFIVYLAVTLSPFAVKPATSNLAFVSSVNVAVAVTLASRFSPFVTVGVPSNLTTKFPYLVVAPAVPEIFKGIVVIAAYPIPIANIATSTTIPITFFLLFMIFPSFVYIILFINL